MALRPEPWGRTRQARAETTATPERRELSQRQQAQHTCEQCGAVLSYEPGASQLVCTYCGHATPIADEPIEIVEYDLTEALERGLDEAPTEETASAKCDSCGAEFTFSGQQHAGSCPFCGQRVVSERTLRRIQPSAVLPFAWDRRTAQDAVGRWLKGLWFAPGKLKAFARRDDALVGMYLPYWTYDSRTDVAYIGERGTIYTEQVRVPAVANGRRVMRTQLVQKVRWQPVRGQVLRAFDDVVVLGSRSLPRKMTEALEPWDLDDLRPYRSEYLTGFQSEAYQVALREGFEDAKEKMRRALQRVVAADIGGDLQRIRRMEIHHEGSTFKHILLPVWLGAYRFGGKTYRICLNGRTGEVQGERPWSVWKLALLVVLIVLVLGVLLLASGGGEQIGISVAPGQPW